tara:strand:- start:7128 stop:8054 length:927 start_codon:yes stop_codon:yes gene_type:complete
VKIYNSIEEFIPKFKVALTLGTFDGVHIGHQSIIEKLNEVAEKIDGESVLMTFYPHPRHVLHPNNQKLKLLSTIEERSEMLKEYGLKHFIIQEFTKKFSKLKSENFVKEILVDKLCVKKLIIGYDHHFGRNREGNYEKLLRLSNLYSYEVEKIDPLNYMGSSVSSTKIRKKIHENKFKEVRKLLGKYFSFSGKIIEGKKMGKKIGYPTANIIVENVNKLMPNDGVYAVYIKVNSKDYMGMMNIGYNPTFNSSKKSVEVHILDFNEDIYGIDVKVSIVEKIRKEKKFLSVEDLKKNLDIDKKKVRQLLS